MTAFELRAYQRDAIDAARERFRQGDRASLVVLPTGAGKTVVFASIARLAFERDASVLVLVHRHELLEQAAAKVRAAAPEAVVEVEQGKRRASDEADVVVASVQTLSRPRRLARWSVDAFALVVVDEAHHALADSYGRILDHFAGARVLGFTATPDRADGRSLSEVFDSVAYSRTMLDLIEAGYLVPLVARTVRVDAFDVEGVRVVRGDLDGRGLADALGQTGVIAALARLLEDHHEGRSTLVFVAGVERAHELADELNCNRPGCAVAVDGSTPAEQRAEAFEAFAAGRVRFLVNVGVATEGTDLPRCACVAIARPTMSRPLFVQMVGRGARLHEGKRDCLVLNFVPSNARHRLVAPTDVLLPADANEDIRARAEELAGELGPAAAVRQAMEEAPEIARQRAVTAYRSTVETWDPFEQTGLGLADLELGMAIEIDLGAVDPDPDAIEIIVRKGVPARVAARMSPGLATAVLRAVRDRERDGLCTLRQASKLVRFGLNPNVSFALASEAMAALAATGWKYAPPSLLADPRFRKETPDAAA